MKNLLSSTNRMVFAIKCSVSRIVTLKEQRAADYYLI